MTNIQKAIILTLISAAVLTFFFFMKDYQQKPSYLSGDEPYYIMMTDNLMRYGNFNLRNEYVHGDSTRYYPGPPLYPQLSPLVNTKGTQWYAIHTVGLPLVILLPYKFFGVTGARIWMIILQFATVIFFYMILAKYLSSRKRRYIGVGLLLSCALFWQNLGAIFPDLLLVSIWGAMLLLFDRKDRLSNAAMAALLVIGALVHSKGFALMAPLMLFNVIWLVMQGGWRGWARKYWPSILILLAGGLGSTYFLWAHYRILFPTQLYGTHGQLFSSNPLVNTIAIITDRNKGLLVYFPLLIIIGPYVVKAAKDLASTTRSLINNKKIQLNSTHYLLAGTGLGLASLLFSVVTFEDWSGSTAPNGRSMLPFVIVAIFLTAKYINLRNRIELTIVGLVSALCVWLSWLSITNFKYYMSVGVNSFWVTKFRPLVHLPMYSQASSLHTKGASTRGAEILLLIIVLNICLILVYHYQYKLVVKKRSLSID